MLTEEDFKRVSRLNRTKDHSNDSELDYVFAGSLAHKDDRVVVGYGKKNPNIARKYIDIQFYQNINLKLIGRLERLIKLKCNNKIVSFLFIHPGSRFFLSSHVHCNKQFKLKLMCIN